MHVAGASRALNTPVMLSLIGTHNKKKKKKTIAHKKKETIQNVINNFHRKFQVYMTIYRAWVYSTHICCFYVVFCFIIKRSHAYSYYVYRWHDIYIYILQCYSEENFMKMYAIFFFFNFFCLQFRQRYRSFSTALQCFKDLKD